MNITRFNCGQGLIAYVNIRYLQVDASIKPREDSVTSALELVIGLPDDAYFITWEGEMEAWLRDNRKYPPRHNWLQLGIHYPDNPWSPVL